MRPRLPRFFRTPPMPPEPPKDPSNHGAVENWLIALEAWGDQMEAGHRDWRRWDRRYGWMFPAGMMVFTIMMIGLNVAVGGSSLFVIPMNLVNAFFQVHLLRKWESRRRDDILKALSN